MRRAVRLIGEDGRIRTVVLRFGALDASVATLYSLRQMVLGLKAGGKRVVAWLPTSGLAEYYLASACDEVVLPEAGLLLAFGLRAEVLFLRDVLALVGIEADLEAVGEYKTGPDTFRRSEMSEPHREMLEAVLDSYYDHIVGAIAGARGMGESSVRDAVNAMPIDGAQAVRLGLADGVLYEDEVPEHIARPATGEAEGDPATPVGLRPWTQVSRWVRRPYRHSTGGAIGVVSLTGMITLGHSRRPPVPLPVPFIQEQAGAQTVAQALRQAEADRRIRAVILHVDSPGGSALASDLIGREVRRLAMRKPVVALMGTQATSGGYYVSACADRIVARPTTVTGSIGVWGGKVVVRGLYDKLGVGVGVVERGEMAGMYSVSVPFDEEQRTRVRRVLAETYARFVSAVARGRNMTDGEVEEIAGGRIWTGVQACECGLVDQVGEYQTALATAKQLAGIQPERECAVVHVRPGRQQLPASPYVREGQELGGALHDLLHLSHEGVWALAPWVVRLGR
jgi:protease-4